MDVLNRRIGKLVLESRKDPNRWSILCDYKDIEESWKLRVCWLLKECELFCDPMYTRIEEDERPI